MGKPVTEGQYYLGFLNRTKTKNLVTLVSHCNYLLMPLYRCVFLAPVFHSFLAAETADTVGTPSEVEAGPGQSFCWQLLGQVGTIK